MKSDEKVPEVPAKAEPGRVEFVPFEGVSTLQITPTSNQHFIFQEREGGLPAKLHSHPSVEEAATAALEFFVRSKKNKNVLSALSHLKGLTSE